MTDRRGMTLLEVVAATLITALLALAIGSAARIIFSAGAAGDRTSRAQELGLSLLEEIIALPFDDPDAPGGPLGPEPGEWAPPFDRRAFDDVDDYTVWDGTQPLSHKSGTPSQISGYRRSVSIEYVMSTDFAVPSAGPTAVKRVTVHVFADTTRVGTYVTIRAQGGRDVDFDG